jgi:hypothetical protein
MYKIFGYDCFLKVFFTWKCIKIYFLFFKNNFDTSTSKWSENIKIIWSNEKNKIILNFLKNTFETQKQSEFYKTQFKKYVKTASQKLRFKLNFLWTL